MSAGRGPRVIAYIGIGSNQGERPRVCREAAAALAALPCTRLAALSPWYETEPLDGAGPAWFINAVAALETGLEAGLLLAELQRLENLAGRSAERALGMNRTLDLDLLLYGGTVRAGAPPVVPHPRLHLRRFVLAPLCDVAPDAVHPVTGRTARELLGALGETGPIVRRMEGSRALPAAAGISRGAA